MMFNKSMLHSKLLAGNIKSSQSVLPVKLRETDQNPRTPADSYTAFKSVTVEWVNLYGY